MSNTLRDDSILVRRSLLTLLAAAGLGPALGEASSKPRAIQGIETMTPDVSLTQRQLAIGPIAAAAAVGDLPRLAAMLNRGLEAGLSINEIKEILVQVYAYAGFPRSLNALGEFMKVLEERRSRGVVDAVGKSPGALPQASEIAEVGTANQTRLSGSPVRGPLFDFAPAIDQFLKSHLFGDIFARDNLDWQSRELATVAMLSAMSGVESQLGSHIRISMNVGLTAGQLDQLASELSLRGDAQAGQRARTALEQHLTSRGIAPTAK